VAFVFIITLAITVALAVMLFWHLYLAVSAQTTIEFYFNRWQQSQAAKEGNHTWRHPYDRGWRQNWHDFFASRGGVLGVVAWALPSMHGSAGDGVNWHVSRDAKAAGAAGSGSGGGAFDQHHYV